MAGPAPAGRLGVDRIIPQMDSIDFRVATGADEGDLRQLLRDNPMPGEISVSLEQLLATRRLLEQHLSAAAA